MKRIVTSGVIFLIVVHLEAKTWKVPSEIPTIKSAIEDSAQYGDTVLVAPGIYDTASGEVFPINMKNGVVLISEKGASSTVIDAYDSVNVINCSFPMDTNTVISRFTITDGDIGIYCCEASPRIVGNVLSYNQDGIYVRTGYGDMAHPMITRNTIVNNIGNRGALLSDDWSRPTVVDNAILDNSHALWVFCQFPPTSVIYNNIYFNTYQPGDSEVVTIGSPFSPNLTNNFWWVTDTADIDSLIYGWASFVPFATAPIESAPGEPLQVYSVRIMKDSSYSIPLDTAQIGNTLYIKLEGLDWNSLFIDPAMVIIRSLKDTYGIGVGLIETDTATGVYHGVAVIDTVSDDVWNKIGANPQDTIIVSANVDPTKCDTVIVKDMGVEEIQEPKIQKLTIYPNPFTHKVVIGVQGLGVQYIEPLHIYDLSGRRVCSLPIPAPKSPITKIIWDGSDNSGKRVCPGIYFCVIKTGQSKTIRKLVVLR